MKQLICRVCDQLTGPGLGAGRFCQRCGGDVVRLDEHPATLGPFLEKAERHLRFLENPARRDYLNAAAGTYYTHEQLLTALSRCRARIRKMKFVLEVWNQGKARGRAR